MIKTKFDSYCLNGFAEGCKYCVKGEKLVLFMTGKCKRDCWYCSLSKKRKNEKSILANEKKCKTIKEVIQEVKDSQATSVGITGGDPLLCLNKTIKLNKTGRRGVVKVGNKFRASIGINNKQKHLGYFKNIEDADKVYQKEYEKQF